MKKFICALLSLTLIFFSMAACGTADKDSDKLNIVCTLFPQYDFTRNIAGNKADVTLLLPAGVESHSFEPTSADMKKISNCDLFIYIGDEMETWASGIIDALGETVEILNLADSIGVKIENHSHDEHDDHDHTGDYDPHLWTDFNLAAQMTIKIADKLTQLDRQNETFYHENANGYVNEINKLKGETESAISTAKTKTIVLGGRFAFKNFTELYGLEVICAYDSCVDHSEPSAATVAGIINTVKEKNIPVVFYEELSQPKVAQTICDETGAEMRLLHSCHNVTADELKNGEGYISLMRQNLENIKEALQ